MKNLYEYKDFEKEIERKSKLIEKNKNSKLKESSFTSKNQKKWNKLKKDLRKKFGSIIDPEQFD
jgi:hypothetical protein